MLANQNSIQNFKIFTDYLILNCAFLISAITTQSLEILLEKPVMLILLLSVNILWYGFARSVHLYDEYKTQSAIEYIAALGKVVFFIAMFSVIFIFFAKELLYTRNFILAFSIPTFFVILFKQYIVRKVLKTLRSKGKYAKKLAIIGHGETAEQFRDSLLNNRELTYDFAGFISDGSENIKSEKLIGTLENVEEALVDNGINEVVIALPVSKLDELSKLLRICDKEAIKPYIIPDYLKYIGSKFTFNTFGSLPIITVRSNPLDEVQWRILKRIFDFTFSSLFLLLMGWWLFGIIGILIKLSSPGKVFFIQDRLGKDNKIFKCFKFRTMTSSASKKTDKFQAVTSNDNRITKIGAILRKYNLDELPQFINVFIGNMSVVGPRPHAIPFNNEYGEIVEEIKLRHRVKPGISGWAQIHGLRGDVLDLEEQIARTKKRIEFDIWYIENWSFWMDIKIIFATVYQAITGKNVGW